MAETKDNLIEIEVQLPLKTGEYTEDGDIVDFDEKPWPRASNGGYYVNCITILTKNGRRLADCYSGRVLAPKELESRLKM